MNIMYTFLIRLLLLRDFCTDLKTKLFVGQLELKSCNISCTVLWLVDPISLSKSINLLLLLNSNVLRFFKLSILSGKSSILLL